ncbi:MAG: hypothetical protein ABL900_00250 [Burkholderiaceae bacterium]
MTHVLKLCVALFVSTLAFSSTAQDRAAGSPATPMADASMPHDCVKPMPRHDHTAEKGMPTPKSIINPCMPSAAASAPAPKAKPRHDHAKFHKNQ